MFYKKRTNCMHCNAKLEGFKLRFCDDKCRRDFYKPQLRELYVRKKLLKAKQPPKEDEGEGSLPGHPEVVEEKS